MCVSSSVSVVLLSSCGCCPLCPFFSGRAAAPCPSCGWCLFLAFSFPWLGSFWPLWPSAVFCWLFPGHPSGSMPRLADHETQTRFHVVMRTRRMREVAVGGRREGRGEAKGLAPVLFVTLRRGTCCKVWWFLLHYAQRTAISDRKILAKF